MTSVRGHWAPDFQALSNLDIEFRSYDNPGVEQFMWVGAYLYCALLESL